MMMIAIAALFSACSESEFPVSESDDTKDNGSKIMVAPNPAICGSEQYTYNQQGVTRLKYALTVMDANGAAAGRIFAPNTAIIIDRPTWSPNGSQISFLTDSSRVGGGYTLRRINVAIVSGKVVGQSNTTLYYWRSSDSIGIIAQAWSSVGSEIVFSKQQTNASVAPSERYCKIMVLPSGGGTPVEIYNEPGISITDLTWSPDGSKIAFSSGNSIKVINRSTGTLLNTYVHADVGINQLDWSRTGLNKIAYTVLLPNFPPFIGALFTIDVNQADPTPVQIAIPNPDRMIRASWSPDNTKFVYANYNCGSLSSGHFFVCPFSGVGVRTFTLSNNATASVSSRNYVELDWKR
jgi:dipeptidyl aminopeptidase/acylaminoacyl peptidase